MSGGAVFRGENQHFVHIDASVISGLSKASLAAPISVRDTGLALMLEPGKTIARYTKDPGSSTSHEGAPP